MSETLWWPGVGQVSKREYSRRLAAAKILCGTEGQPPHSWTVPVVGDDTVVCGYCGKGVALLDPTASPYFSPGRLSASKSSWVSRS